MKIWRKIDLGNLIVFSGPTRDSVDRYKDDFSVEHQMKYTLFKSRNHLNQCERNDAEDWKRQQRIAREKERDALDAKEYWEKNSRIYEKMECRESFEYLSRQGLSIGVLEQVKFKLARLNSSLGKTGNIY